EDTASISSNGHVPQQSSPPSPPPPHPPRPLGSILRQPSPPGEARNGRQQSETRRVSFSSAPVKVATIPPNPPKENYHYRQQRNGITSRNGIRVPNGTAQQQQSLPPSGNNSNNNNNNSWFRSLFSSSAKTTASDNNSSSSSLTNGSLKSSSQKSFADGTGGSTEFRPLNNTQLLESIPLALTQSFDGRQLRLTDWEKGLGDNDEPEAALDAADYIDLISSQEQLANNLDILDSPPPFQLAQPKPFRLDSRKVGLLMFNRDGICGFSNIKSKPLELTLKKLLVQNIMEEVPTPKTATNPLLRARASPAMQAKKPLSEIPSSVTATLSAESRSKTDKAHIRGVDLSKLEMDVFNSTLAEMIFGAISIAQKPLKSMIDARYVNGAKLCAFKLHHLGTEWRKTCTSLRLSLTPQMLFAYDLFKLGIANIRTCFYWMLYRLVDFMNAVRLKGDLAEGETTDVLVDLLQRYDNKEHAFFVSNLLSTLFAFAYRQDRFKVVLWTSQADRLPMMCQVATLTSQFLARSVHQISDEVVITPDYRFVVPESLRTAEQFELQEEEKEEEDGGNTTAERANDAYANQETEFLNFQPIPAGSSCSSTLSTVTAIQVQTSGCSGVQTSSLIVESTTSTTISASGQSGGQQPPSHNCHSCCNESKSSESHCQSRDESIGYDSLSESAISGNVSPVNNEEVVSYGGEDEEDGRQRENAPDSSTTEAYQSSAEAVLSSSFNHINKTKQNYFRGYVDLRYKDGQQQEEGADEQENAGSKTELILAKTLAITAGSITSQSEDASSALKMALTSQSESTSSLHDASSSSSFSSSGSLSASASALYHFSWLSLPVITTQHLEMVTTQVIFGETLAQASTRQRDTTERNDSPPETYEYLLSRLSAKLKEEECNDTIFLVNCDTMAMNLLERALNEAPGSRCGPVMSSAVAAACERLLSLATIEGRRFQVWEFIRYTATQLLLKSEVLQSVLTHDLHLLMSSRSVKRNGNGSSSDTDLLLDIYINEETREYARKVWAELIGDQTVNVYLTSDGPKAAFDLFRFRVPTSALYLFSDYHLSTFYLPSATTTRLLDFDSSDLLVIVGLRKLFLRSREPLITAMHGRENAKTFDYLLKYPQFLKNNQNGSES
ncbi:hypothetical protein TYRP_015792, partial [Tyrophagus putrescentiae]